MIRSEIIEKLSNYFIKQELVGHEVYEYYTNIGKDPWTCLDTNALHCLLIMREGIGLPFTVNDWQKGGRYDERGHRANIQEIVKGKTDKGIVYLSAHPMGKAFDFKVKGMSSDDVRQWIVDNACLFPCKIRLEHKILKTGKTITWVHFDVIWEEQNPKVYLFDI